MPNKNKYIINEQNFKNLQEIRSYIHKIRDSYKNYSYLNTDDFDFMRSLLDRHEHASKKIGCGVKAIYIKNNKMFKQTREFWLVRTDGSETDFSYKVCLRNKTESMLTKFKTACRVAIENEIMEFKRSFFKNRKLIHRCPFTKEVITLTNSHVDHAYPWTFNKIVMEFIKIYRIDINNIEIRGILEDAVTQNSLSDKLKNDFISFHNRLATLRVVSKKANLSILRRGKLSIED